MFTSRVPTPMEVAVASLLRRVGTGRGTGSMPGCVQTCPRGLCPHFLCPGVFTLFLMVKAGQESPQKASGWARGPGEWVTQQVAIGACHTGQLSGRLTEKNNEGSGLPQKQGGREDSSVLPDELDSQVGNPRHRDQETCPRPTSQNGAGQNLQVSSPCLSSMSKKSQVQKWTCDQIWPIRAFCLPRHRNWFEDEHVTLWLS